MSSLGLNSTKSAQFFNGEHKHAEFLKLLHAATMIGFHVKISLKPSDFPFGKISIESYNKNKNALASAGGVKPFNYPQKELK